MKQKTIEKSLQESDSRIEKLKEEFEEIKNKPLFRKVQLTYSACCGCGCYNVIIERTVQEGSELKNGDRISKLEPEDKLIG